MSHESPTDEPRLVSMRTMDIVVALLLLGGSAIVITDSMRLGFHWIDNEGPASGYFPFYIALGMAIASAVNLVSAVLGRTANGNETFVSKPAFRRVLAVLIPAIIYVGAVQYLGIYVASGLYIIVFMLTLGRETLLKALAVGIGVPLVLFLMFEVWFLVPLPKGPLEIWFGY